MNDPGRVLYRSAYLLSANLSLHVLQHNIVLDFHATTIIGPILVQGAQDTDPIGGRFKHTGAWTVYFHGSFRSLGFFTSTSRCSW
jgi:hypothetical protein